jgi:hypothetical protein
MACAPRGTGMPRAFFSRCYAKMPRALEGVSQECHKHYAVGVIYGTQENTWRHLKIPRETSCHTKCRAKRRNVTKRNAARTRLGKNAACNTWHFSEFRAQPRGNIQNKCYAHHLASQRMPRAPFGITQNAARTI